MVRVFWEIINSPIILTILSLLCGGIVASYISNYWQKRSQRHSLKLALAKEILDNYQSYSRFVSRETSIENGDEFDKLHSALISNGKISKVIFDKTNSDNILKLANRFCNVQHCRKNGKHKQAEEQLEKAHREADDIIDYMFKLING